ncbi:3-oxoacyl-ACP reductase [Kutzneria sp. NPDC051319]|uniref:3-oxoacyl-ACP reductase n=1 Tax=Kutzneria sp. NPDC051319 TaxID=3155047 RepID=UPI003424B7E5
MSDPYLRFAQSGFGRFVTGRLGLPRPAHLRRHRPGQPALAGPVLTGGSGRLDAVLKAHATGGDAPYGGLVFDATGIDSPEQLRALHTFFNPVIRQLAPCGRVVVLGTPPEELTSVPAVVAQRALEGFVRSAAKELRAGSTAQLVYVSEGAEPNVESTLRFLLSAKSAYVSGQVIRVGAAEVVEPVDWEHPLADRVALVTGASRGIGAAIAEVLARDGAHVVCLDIAAQGSELSEVANRVGGSAVQMDITSTDAPARLVEYFQLRHEGVDIVVHNAGITRDKTLARMTESQWDAVLSVNLASQLRVNDGLLKAGALRRNGRIVGVSSIAGIAGNVGQTNYATSKAGVIGMVRSLAPELASRGSTINAVAPGFIETKMTAAVPLFIRQAGRLMNSMSQGGLPVDVAETIAWYANPASSGVNGNIVRVCGQSLLGA